MNLRVAVLIFLAITRTTFADESTLPIIASVKSNTDLEFMAPLSGEIKKLNISIGSKVNKGDVIATVDCTNEKLGRGKAKALVAKADAALQKSQDQHMSGLISTTELNVSKADAAVARAGLIQVNQSIGRCKIKSPVHGIVVDLLAKKGSWIQQGSPIAHIIDNKSLYILAMVSEVRWPELNIGDTIMLEGKFIDVGVVKAVITHKSPFINQQRRFRINADLPKQNPSDENLIVGMKLREKS